MSECRTRECHLKDSEGVGGGVAEAPHECGLASGGGNSIPNSDLVAVEILHSARRYRWDHVV